MQKLEEILHAEDSARHRLAEAQEKAAQIAREAAAEAELVQASAKRVAAVAAAANREAIVADARTKADLIRAAADRDLSTMLATAEARVPWATQAVTQELTG